MSGKVALVTGASRGIGFAIAKQLASSQYQVVGTATTEQGAEGIANAIPGVKGLVLDVSNSQSIDQCLQAMTEQIGAPEILVNNAGVTRDNLMMRMKDDEWDQVIQTNLSSIFRLCRASLKPMMKARWGRIVNISSVVGSTGNPGQANYAAAKAGMIGLTKSLAKEVGSRGITVNTVSPGFIDTDMTKELPEAQKESLLSAIALGRLGQPEEIAHAVEFLCAPGAAYITGETLHVNGGMYMP
ncbi:MAG: 3-oxoacyl-ACP reductase FabG [Gammaproteobacteria bacterium]|nr:3-oxoacyl-ACP reductase FabG [Gammaproteobacteria bacterium]